VPSIRGLGPAPRAGPAWFARDHRAATLPDGDKPFVRKDSQGLVNCDGSASTGASWPEVIASRMTAATWAHTGQAAVGVTSMAGNAECSMNGLPEQARLPHWCSRA
jgi:hypothetical protein